MNRSKQGCYCDFSSAAAYRHYWTVLIQTLPAGCRQGICHFSTGKFCSLHVMILIVIMDFFTLTTGLHMAWHSCISHLYLM